LVHIWFKIDLLNFEKSWDAFSTLVPSTGRVSIAPLKLRSASAPPLVRFFSRHGCLLVMLLFLFPLLVLFLLLLLLLLLLVLPAGPFAGVLLLLLLLLLLLMMFDVEW